MAATREKRKLFGGALWGAGLTLAVCQSTPVAAEFVPGAYPPDPNFTSVFAFDHAYTEIAFDSSENDVGGFPSPASYTGPGGSLYAAAGPTYMGGFVEVGNPSVWGSAGISVVQVFTVDEARNATLEWDLTAADFPSLAYVISFDTGPIANYGPGTSGSVSLDFLPGVLYGFIGRVGSGLGPGDVSDGYVRLIWVPTPGAIAMVGLAAVAMRRRRRG